MLCRFENYIGGIRKQLCDFEMTCWPLCGVETTQVKLKLLYCGVKVESRFACFYLTRQLEWKLRKFQLAEVVLVVSKPHVFNLTGQLVSTPPECSTLAATDRAPTPLLHMTLRPCIGKKNIKNLINICMFNMSVCLMSGSCQQKQNTGKIQRNIKTSIYIFGPSLD